VATLIENRNAVDPILFRLRDHSANILRLERQRRKTHAENSRRYRQPFVKATSTAIVAGLVPRKVTAPTAFGQRGRRPGSVLQINRRRSSRCDRMLPDGVMIVAF
jgi:hypothetical protein